MAERGRSPLLVASLAAGLLYPLAWRLALPAAASIALKGLGVGLLALLAATRARSRDGWMLAAYAHTRKACEPTG